MSNEGAGHHGDHAEEVKESDTEGTHDLKAPEGGLSESKDNGNMQG